MKREHQRPAVAFALVSVLGAVMLGQGLPADELSDLFGLRDADATSQRPDPPAAQQPTDPSGAPTTAAPLTPIPPTPTPTIEVLGAQAEVGEDDRADEGHRDRSAKSVPALPNVPKSSFTELAGAGLSLADLLTQ